jgi:hypothetical protein
MALFEKLLFEKINSEEVGFWYAVPGVCPVTVCK